MYFDRDRHGRDRYERDRGFRMNRPVRKPEMKNRSKDPFVLGQVLGEADKLQRKLNGMLNKMVESNFDTLSVKFISAAEESCNSWETMLLATELIFEKSLKEQMYSKMYSELALKMKKHLGSRTFQETIGAVKVSWGFERMLVRYVQKEFLKGTSIDIKKNENKQEIIEERFKQKSRILGNVKFVGELFLKQIISESITLDCIAKLIEIGDSSDEDIEAVCKIFKTVGKKLDSYGKTISKTRMNYYFEIIHKMVRSQDSALTQRSKYLLMDCIDLRKNGWQEIDVKKQQELHAQQQKLQQQRPYRAQWHVGMGRLRPQNSYQSNIQNQASVRQFSHSITNDKGPKAARQDRIASGVQRTTSVPNVPFKSQDVRSNVPTNF